jgi:hypothetical protein
MASTTQDKLYEAFVAISGQRDSNLDETLDSGAEIAASLSDIVKQIGELQGSSAAQAASGSSTATAGTTSGSSSATASTTSGGDSSTTAGTTGGGGASPASTATGGGASPASTATGGGASPASTATGGGVTPEAIAATVLESGLGMVPLVVGLLELFGGGGTPVPPALVKYAMPDPIYFEGADTGSDVSGADYDQMGMPRAYSAAPSATSAQASGMAAPGSSSGSAAGGVPAPQITVNVQAMDSRSFLDHSSEIAQAVRDAMLNLNSINDVVNDL